MIVLQFEWGKLRKSSKGHLNTSLQNAASRLVSSNSHAYHLCLRSLRIANNPWNYPIVTKITNGTPISESEGILYFWSVFYLTWAGKYFVLIIHIFFL